MNRPSLKVKTRSVGASKEVFTTETIDEMVRAVEASEDPGRDALFSPEYGAWFEQWIINQLCGAPEPPAR